MLDCNTKHCFNSVFMDEAFTYECDCSRLKFGISLKVQLKLEELVLYENLFPFGIGSIPTFRLAVVEELFIPFQLKGGKMQ